MLFAFAESEDGSPSRQVFATRAGKAHSHCFLEFLKTLFAFGEKVAKVRLLKEDGCEDLQRGERHSGQSVNCSFLRFHSQSTTHKEIACHVCRPPLGRPRRVALGSFCRKGNASAKLPHLKESLQKSRVSVPVGLAEKKTQQKLQQTRAASCLEGAVLVLELFVHHTGQTVRRESAQKKRHEACERPAESGFNSAKTGVLHVLACESSLEIAEYA